MSKVELVHDTMMIEAMGLVDLDATLWINLGLFVVLMLVLNTLIFQPYLRIVRERDALTEGAQEEASALVDEAAELLSRYEAGLAEARAEANALRDEQRTAAVAQEASLISVAREDAAATLTGARAEVEKQVVVATAQVDAQAKALAKSIADRMVPQS